PDAASVEPGLSGSDETESAALRPSFEIRRLHDLATRVAGDRFRLCLEVLEGEVRGRRHRTLDGGNAPDPDRSRDPDASAMKRALIIAGAVLILGVIVFASVRASGTKAEKVYAEGVKARKIEAVVTA